LIASRSRAKTHGKLVPDPAALVSSTKLKLGMIGLLSYHSLAARPANVSDEFLETNQLPFALAGKASLAMVFRHTLEAVTCCREVSANKLVSATLLYGRDSWPKEEVVR
jgi:hypothetical protein